MKRTLSWCIQTLLIFLSFSCHRPERTPAISAWFQLKDQVVNLTSVRDSLDVPWEIRYDNGFLWYSLQKGEIWRTSLANGETHKLLNVPGVYRQRTMGALGMAVDHIGDAIHVYLVFNQRTDSTRLDTSSLVTRLVRYTYDPASDTLIMPKTILQWTANTGHNGSRVMIGKHDDLYITTGDISEDRLAQNTQALNGKVLRVMKDGSVPGNNPFPGSYVWSYGHRNQQGICLGDNDSLYASEHGDAIEDEVNLIEPGRNYGWPLVEGRLDQPEEIRKVDSGKLLVTEPLISWTPTIAPAAITYYGNGPIAAFKNSLLLVTLKGSALYVLHLDAAGKKITGQDIFFKNMFGRLRSICTDPEGQVYIGTSNRDWNPSPGYPKPTDDHILKISAADAGNIDKTSIKDAQVKDTTAAEATDKGKTLFLNYCSSCHKPEGEGLAGNFPPLKDNPTLKDTEKLLQILEHGRTGDQKIMGNLYTQNMPSFAFLADDQMLDLVNYLKGHLVKDQPLSLATLQMLRKGGKIQ